MNYLTLKRTIILLFVLVTVLSLSLGAVAKTTSLTKAHSATRASTLATKAVRAVPPPSVPSMPSTPVTPPATPPPSVPSYVVPPLLLVPPPSHYNNYLIGGGFDPVTLSPVTLDVAQETVTEFDATELLSSYHLNDATLTGTDVSQYIRFMNTGTNAFTTTGQVRYDVNWKDELGDYLYFQDGTDMFSYELEFQNGLESTVVNNHLVDVEDQRINVLGQSYYVSEARLFGMDALTMKLARAQHEVLLNEGAVEDFPLTGLPSGPQVEVNVISVTSPTSVLLNIDGHLGNFDVGEYVVTPARGVSFVILDIIQGTPNQVLLALGDVELVQFTDGDTADNAFDLRGVYVNAENIEDGKVNILGTTIPSGNFEIQKIEYRLAADNMGPSGADVHIGAGEVLRQHLDEPEGMIHANWDMFFSGLHDTGVAPFKLDINGDDQYNFRFTNREGIDYVFSYVDNSNGAGLGFNLGDEDDNLYFVEPANECDFFIEEDATFVLTDDNDPTGITRVFSYEGFDDPNNELTFTDLGTGNVEITYQDMPNHCGPGTLAGEGTIVAGGNTFVTFIDLTPGSSTYGQLTVDFTSDGNVDGDEANVIANGGFIIDLNTANNGLLQQEPALSTSFEMSVTVPESETTYRGYLGLGDDVITVDILDVAFNEVDAAVTSGVNLVVDPQDINIEMGRSAYGIFVEHEGRNPAEPSEVTFTAPFLEQEADVYLIWNVQPACSDGIDNDFDGHVDYPADPACISAQDDDEGPNNRLCGDVDLNGRVEVVDALYVAQHGAGLITLIGQDLACADVDNSSSVDVSDAFLISRASAGLPVQLTCPATC